MKSKSKVKYKWIKAVVREELTTEKTGIPEDVLMFKRGTNIYVRKLEDGIRFTDKDGWEYVEYELDFDRIIPEEGE
jgi:hypothetical protein